jgi:stage II sporulation protein M
MRERPAVRSWFSLSRALREEARTVAAAFAVLVAISFVTALLRPEAVEPLLRLFTDAAAEMGLYQINGADLMLTILANNLLTLLMMTAVGLIPFLHLSALSLGLNAILIGGLAAFYQSSGLGLAAFLAGTLPHGVTELAAMVLACAAGLYLCRATTYAALRRVDRQTVARTLQECLRVYTRWIVPLLLVSAALEAFVTPLILGRFL